MRVVFMLFGLVGVLQAYTDPGTGFLMWQIMLAVFAGVAFRFRSLVGRLFGKREPSGGPPPSVEDDRN